MTQVLQKPARRLIVRSGVIVEPLTRRLAGDPMWVRWMTTPVYTDSYVPFQNTDDYVYTPVDQRDEYVGV